MIVTIKSVFGVCDQAMLNPARSVTGTSWKQKVYVYTILSIKLYFPGIK